MNTTNMVPPTQQQPDGDGSTDGDGDNDFRIGEAKTLTPSRSPKSRSAADQSTHNIESTLFRPSADNVNVTTTCPLELELDVEVAYSSPTPFDVDNGNDNYEDNSHTSPLRSLAKSLWVSPKPTYTDVPDDVVTPTTPTLTQLDQTFAQRTHDQDPQDRIEEPMPINDVWWQQWRDGSTDDGDDLVISDVKTLISGSIPNLSSAFRSDGVDEEDAAAVSPNSSGVTAADSITADSSFTNKVEPAQQDRPNPPKDDVSDDTPLVDDLCEEGCVSPTPMVDHDSFQDNDINDNNERQSLCRDPSIKTSQESEFTKRCLPEDTFSFFVYSRVLPIPSPTFVLATCVFILQMFIYAVLAYDITSVSSNKKNPVKLPVNVEVSVKIAEFLAIVVAIITQDEVRIAVNLIRDGFDEGLEMVWS